jgi:hypothetical protein
MVSEFLRQRLIWLEAGKSRAPRLNDEAGDVDEAQSNADLVVAGFDLAFYGLRRSGSPGGAVRNGGSGSNCDIATVQKSRYPDQI